MRTHTPTAPRRAWLGLVAGLTLAALPGVAVAQDLTVEQVRVEDGDTPQVVLALSSAPAGSAVSTFTMSDPDRVIVDIADARVAPEAGSIQSDSPLVDRVEVETFDDGQGIISRARIYLASSATHTVQVVGDRVIVTLVPGAVAADPLAAALGGGSSAGSMSVAPTTDIRQPSGPCLSGSGCAEGELPSGPRVRSLDYKQFGETARLVIGTNEHVSYTASQPRNNLIVVDLAGVFLPQSLQRPLDTSEFVSPVKGVRAARTSSGTRLSIDLRVPGSDFVVREAGANELYVDIPIPRAMLADLSAQQYGSAVGPSTPADQGLSNAYQSEVLIGQGGRTIDPRAAFGTGGGVMDASSTLGFASGFMFETSDATSLPYSGRRISLDFVNADIHSIFRLISSVSRLNIVAGDEVKGTVTVRMEDVPWDQAFAAVLQAKGLGSQRFGNVVRVAPIEKIKSEQQAALEAKRAKEELTDLDMLILPLNYATPKEVVPQVKSVLTSRGSVEQDTRGNQIIVRETADRLAQVRELVRHLDKQTPQVLIEARIVEANTSYTRGFGIQWGGEIDASTATGYSTGLFFPNSIGMSGGLTTTGGETFYTPGGENLFVDLGTSGSTGALALSLGSIPGLIDLDARLSALESDGWGKVVSTPRVTTVDNKEASIKQGTRIPYLSASSSGTNVRFVNATLELNVTPHITSDDKIFLSVEVTNNRADFSNLVQGQPALQVKEATTELLVADGETTVLGGVFATEDAFAQDSVPGLSKIPLLGLLFKNSSRNTTRNELLVFITPHIVSEPSADAG